MEFQETVAAYVCSYCRTPTGGVPPVHKSQPFLCICYNNSNTASSSTGYPCTSSTTTRRFCTRRAACKMDAHQHVEDGSCCSSERLSSGSGLTGEGFKQYAETLESLFPRSVPPLGECGCLVPFIFPKQWIVTHYLFGARSVPETIFIEKMSGVLGHHGFTPDNAINLVSTCRDELCRPFVQHLDKGAGRDVAVSLVMELPASHAESFLAAASDLGPQLQHLLSGGHGVLRPYGVQGSHGARTDGGRERKVHLLGGSSHGAADPRRNWGGLQAGELPLCHIARNPSDSVRSGAIAREAARGLAPTVRPRAVADRAHLPTRALRDVRYSHRQLYYPGTHVGVCVLPAEAAVDQSCCEFVIVSGIQIHGALGQNFFWPGSISSCASHTNQWVCRPALRGTNLCVPSYVAWDDDEVCKRQANGLVRGIRGGGGRVEAGWVGAGRGVGRAAGSRARVSVSGGGGGRQQAAPGRGAVGSGEEVTLCDGKRWGMMGKRWGDDWKVVGK
eukprot:3929167-Rhodomonas_salina.8